MWFHRTEKRKTPWGEFERAQYGWKGQVTVGARKLAVMVDDVNGEPNPQLLALLPYIDQNLATLERAAQAAVTQLREYELSLITDPDDEAADFSFMFDACAEDADDSITVEFKAGQVTGWQRLD